MRHPARKPSVGSAGSTPPSIRLDHAFVVSGRYARPRALTTPPTRRWPRRSEDLVTVDGRLLRARRQRDGRRFRAAAPTFLHRFSGAWWIAHGAARPRGTCDHRRAPVRVVASARVPHWRADDEDATGGWLAPCVGQEPANPQPALLEGEDMPVGDEFSVLRANRCSEPFRVPTCPATTFDGFPDANGGTPSCEEGAARGTARSQPCHANCVEGR